jgi:hypothetical protein
MWDHWSPGRPTHWLSRRRGSNSFRVVDGEYRLARLANRSFDSGTIRGAQFSSTAQSRL